MSITRRSWLAAAGRAAAGGVLAASPLLRVGVAAAAEPLRVGLLLPYSKVYAVLGESITDGMRVAFEAADNTAAGRKVELVREDEETPQVALRKVRKLVQSDQVDFLVGPVSSAVAAAIRDFVHQSRVPLLVANAGDDSLSRERCSQYIFRTSFSNWQTGWAFGAYAARKVGKTAFVSGADYAAGRQITGGFKESYVAAGGRVIGEAFAPLGTTDYGPYLAQIKAAAPELSFSFFAGSDAVNFVRQYAEYGLKASIKLTGSGFLLSDDVLPAQGDAALGALSTMHYTNVLDNPENRSFKERYQRLTGKPANVYAVQGYDTARVITDALGKTAGATGDRDALMKAIRGVAFASPRGRFRFDPATHNVVQDFYILEVRRGEGGLVNAPLETVKDVRDPGGCKEI
jgi:branched-chain amino acid transport system substrate-binding protein